MIFLFDIERGPDGWPKLTVPTPDPPTPKQAFKRRCYAAGITDSKLVAELWVAEKAKLDKAKQEAKKSSQVIKS